MQSIFSLSLSELSDWLLSHGEQAFRARQIFEWLYKKNVTSFEAMRTLSASLRSLLTTHFTLLQTRLVAQEQSQDLETIKFLFELADGKQIESVLILSEGRRTVCVSSQVGCPARCAFCASGRAGWIRNLSKEEIFEQIFQIQCRLQDKAERVSHIVFMGMGEPFENYDAVLSTIRMCIDPERLQIAQRRITVSTVGVIEGIRRFSEEGLQVHLVLSLHAPTQDLRKKLIPYARRPENELGALIGAMVAFAQKTRRDITYEYTLMRGVNDQALHAQELARLVKGQPCTVNLIPYNPVPGLRLHRPDKRAIETFREILESAGIDVTWRYTKGKDIAAACGQLAMREENLKKIPQKEKERINC